MTSLARRKQYNSDLCSGEGSAGHLSVLPFWLEASEMERRWKVPSRLDEGKSVIVFRAVCSQQDSNRAWWSYCSGVCRAELKVTWGLRANFWQWALAGWVKKKPLRDMQLQLLCNCCNGKRVLRSKYGASMGTYDLCMWLLTFLQ